MQSPDNMAIYARQCPQTTEMVTDGHPDKLCDQSADAILDAALCQSPTSRTAIECLAKDNLMIVSGEMLTPAPLDIEAIVQRVLRRVGYAFEPVVINYIKRQSPDIAVAIDPGGAGDQGIMIGCATNETPEMLPRVYVLARQLCWQLKQCRENGAIPWLRPDGKSQVTVRDGRVTCVVIAAHHDQNVDIDEVRQVLRQQVVEPVVGPDVPRVMINGTGVFTVGGPHADAGVVGRKIVADAYGPSCPVGGGAYSGKDPSKVDRSAAYMARHIAKTVVAYQVAEAKTCQVTLAYGIGQHQPEMVHAFVNGDPYQDVSEWVHTHFRDLSPTAIIEYLGLRRPQGWSYLDTAAFGHYGRAAFPWEVPAAIR